MAQIVSKIAAQYREAAEKHRRISELYLRLAAQQELADTLERAGAQLEETRDSVAKLKTSIDELAKSIAAPVPVGRV